MNSFFQKRLVTALYWYVNHGGVKFNYLRTHSLFYHLFFVEMKKTKAEMKRDLQTSIERRRNSSFVNVFQEPSKIVWIHRDEFDDVMIGLEYFVHNNKVYKTLPSYAACMELSRRKLLIKSRRSA